MTNVSPDEMLNLTRNYAKSIAKAKSSHVAVGLPAEKVGGKVYGDGNTVIKIGAIHEYGSVNIPRRSFLNVPFQVKEDEISRFIATQFEQVLSMKTDAETALGLVGAASVNIAKGAFTSRGYGTWPDIKTSTKERKNSSQTLIDTGILRGSITYVVRS